MHEKTLLFPLCHFCYSIRWQQEKDQNLDGNWKLTNQPCHMDYDYLVDLDSPDVVRGLLTFSKLSELPLLHVPQENRSGNVTKCNYVTT